MQKGKIQLVGKAKVFVITCGEDHKSQSLPVLALLTGVGRQECAMGCV